MKISNTSAAARQLTSLKCSYDIVCRIELRRSPFRPVISYQIFADPLLIASQHFSPAAPPTPLILIKVVANANHHRDIEFPDPL